MGFCAPGCPPGLFCLPLISPVAANTDLSPVTHYFGRGRLWFLYWKLLFSNEDKPEVSLFALSPWQIIKNCFFFSPSRRLLPHLAQNSTGRLDQRPLHRLVGEPSAAAWTFSAPWRALQPRSLCFNPPSVPGPSPKRVDISPGIEIPPPPPPSISPKGSVGRDTYLGLGVSSPASDGCKVYGAMVNCCGADLPTLRHDIRQLPCISSLRRKRICSGLIVLLFHYLMVKVFHCVCKMNAY